jgi:uncharacterized membrane protein YfcA
MDPAAALIYFVAGAAMGWINNVAGGAGVFALWAFEYAGGMPIEIANPTARVGAVAIGVFSFLGYLRAGRRPDGRAWRHGLLAVPGALLGSVLAMRLEPIVFRAYLATVMALLLRQQLRRRTPVDDSAPRPAWLVPLGCVLVGLHMGFAQVGFGLLVTLVLAGAYRGDLVAVNAAKSTIVILTAITSVGSFAAFDAIAWLPGLVLAAGAAAGSYLASHWSVQKGSNAVRRVVVAVAVITLAEQLLRIVLLLATGRA